MANSMRRAAITLSSAALLVACGGGTDDGVPTDTSADAVAVTTTATLDATDPSATTTSEAPATTADTTAAAPTTTPDTTTPDTTTPDTTTPVTTTPDTTTPVTTTPDTTTPDATEATTTLGSSDLPADALPTAALRDRIAAFAGSLTFTDVVAPELPTAEFDGCPVDDYSTLLNRLFGPLLPADAGVVTFADGAIVSTPTGFATRFPITGVDLLGCAAESDTGSNLGLDVATAPGDLEAFLREFNDPGSLDDLQYDFVPSGAAFGGQFVQFDMVAVDDPDFTSSEVIWLDDNVLVTAWTFGSELAEIDLDALQRNLAAELPTLVATALG